MTSYRITERTDDSDELVRVVADGLTFSEACKCETENKPSEENHLRMERKVTGETWEWL